MKFFKLFKRMLPRIINRRRRTQTFFNIVIIILLVACIYMNFKTKTKCFEEFEVPLYYQEDEALHAKMATKLPKHVNSSSYFLHNPRDLCQSRSKAKMRTVVIAIHTARHHYQARNVIRKTFGSVKTFRTWHFAHAFIVGRPKFRNESDPVLTTEIGNYGDIIIADFVDTYRNLSLKHLAGLKWATEYCPTAEFYIKTDDDYLVEIFRAMTLMATIPRDDTNYYCMKAVKWVPNRYRKSKYFMSRREYAPDVFPTFCAGLYITRMETIRRVHAMAVLREVKQIPMEDAFVTGLIREHINRKLMQKHMNQTHKNTNTNIAVVDTESNIGKIGIMNKLADHTQLWQKNISFHIKNTTFIEIYTAGKTLYACKIWDSVLRIHELLGIFETC